MQPETPEDFVIATAEQHTVGHFTEKPFAANGITIRWEGTGLEEKGFVESYEKEAVGKIRKYYHITRSGKKELKKKSEEWKEYSKAVLDVMGGVCFG